MSKYKKWWLALGSFVVLLVLFLSFWPQLFHHQIENIARKEIGRRLTAEVTFSHLDISVWKNFPDLTISLSDLRIITTGAERDSLLSADEIAASFNFIHYLEDGGVDITGIFAERPRLHAHVEADGTTNFSIVKSDTTSRSNDSTTNASIEMILEEIVVTNGHIEYVDDASDNHFKAEGFSFEGKGDFSNAAFDMNAKLESTSASLVWEKRTFFENKKIDFDLLLAIDRLKHSVQIKESDLRINSFAFLLSGGVVFHPDRYEMDIAFSAPNTSLVELLSLTNFVHANIENIESDGNVHFGGFVKGHYIPGTDSIPKFLIALEVKQGALKIDSLEEAIRDIHFDLDVINTTGHVDSTEIKLDSIFFKIQEHAVQGHAHIKHLVNSRVDAYIAGTAHAPEVLKVYPIQGLSANGELSFEIEVLGKYSTLKWPEEIPHVDFDIDMINGMLKYDSLPDSLNNISFHMAGQIPQGNWHQSKVDIESLSLNIGDNPVSGRLQIENFNTPKIDGSLTASIHLEDILTVIPIQGLEMKGTLNTNIDVEGIYNPTAGTLPAITASLAIENGYYKTTAYPEPLENVHVKASLINTGQRLESTELKIEQFQYTLENEPFDVKGVIRDFKSFAYDIDAKGIVDLAKITKLYPIEGYALSGKISSDIDVSGTLADLEEDRYDKTKANGFIKADNVMIVGKKLPLPITIASADVALTPQVVQLNAMHVISGHSEMNLSGELHDYLSFFTKDDDKITAKLKVVADTLNLNEWKAAFSSDQKNTPTISADADQVKSVWQVPSFMDFEFDSDIGHIIYEDMKLSDLAGEIHIKDGVLTMRESGFNSLNAKFLANGSYDSRDTTHPLFDFNLKIDELDIQRAYKEMKLVRDLVPAAADAEGVFSIDYKLKGELEPTMYPKTATLVGNGDIHIANAKINGMKMFEQLSKAAKKEEMNDPHLRDFVMSTEIHDNKIFVKPFKLKVSGFNTEIEGVNEISGAINYLIKVQLLPMNLVKVPFHVTGTYDNPKVALGKN